MEWLYFNPILEMGKKKKPFIDKKRSVQFHLVHRDQRDPLQADSDASEMVLHAVEDKVKTDDEQKQYGIYFDDDYDYLQHLKPRGHGVLVMADEPNPSSQGAMFKDVGGIQLPAEALPSEFEEEEGMLGKGVLPRGPQPDWDPDIVEALDDGLDLENPSNLLEDDFVMLANGGEASAEYYDDGEYESGDEYSDRGFDSDDLGSDNGSYDRFGHEETKSRFTNYSMTSSVIRRAQGLQLLDDQFEKIMEEYDDDQIGELSGDDEGGDRVEKHDWTLMEQAMGELDDTHDFSNLETEKVEHITDGHVDDDDIEEVEKYTEPERERWDCESIISTYSNLYNHPKLITEPKPIKLTKRLGIPTDVLKKSGKGEKVDIDMATEADQHPVVNHSRKKNETKDEKKVRKNAVKEERRNRRFEKKANKLAFKDEQKIQEKILASQPIKSTLSM